MGTGQTSLLGVGIYTVPEAARMTRVSSGRIRRWLLGYRFKVGDKLHESPAVWSPDLSETNEALVLSFRDLVEVRFVDYFLTKGVSWKVLRKVAPEAARLVKDRHPFSTREFKTDGRDIFRDIGEKHGKSIRTVLTKQLTIAEFVAPALYAGLEYYKNNPARWFPLRDSKLVVIDPAISFGQPTLNPEGVPTVVLARSFRAENDVARVANWYRVPKRSVHAALRYEQFLAA